VIPDALSGITVVAVQHGVGQRVRVEVTVREVEVTARVTDQGTGFDHTTVPDPTLPGNLSKSGGRGIFLMRSLMDEVRFNEEGNSVTLILRLEEGRPDFAGGASA